MILVKYNQEFLMIDYGLKEALSSLQVYLYLFQSLQKVLLFFFFFFFFFFFLLQEIFLILIFR